MSEIKPDRFNRGGSWCNDQRGAQAVRRDSDPACDHYDILGVRLVEVVEDQTPASRPFRDFRGSSRGDFQHYAQLARRTNNVPDLRYSSLGVRLVEVTDG